MSQSKPSKPSKRSLQKSAPATAPPSPPPPPKRRKIGEIDPKLRLWVELANIDVNELNGKQIEIDVNDCTTAVTATGGSNAILQASFAPLPSNVVTLNSKSQVITRAKMNTVVLRIAQSENLT